MDTNPLRVLIVEDSADDAKLLVHALAKGGLDVTSTRVDTREAMQAALDAGNWDLVLADHSMPRFSALAALETLKQSSLDLPFIIVSGLIGEDVAVEAMRAGAHDYVTKGKVARLVPAIKRELKEAIVRRERNQAIEALRAAYAELERRVQERTEELAAANEELTATSERLRLHQEREIAALRELDRKKDEFLSVAAHELKTPVTTVLGFSQALLRHYEKSGAFDEARLSRGLKTITKQSWKLAQLVSQLLDTSRIEGGHLSVERQCADLAGIVGDVVNTTRHVAAGREIMLDSPARGEAFVDPVRIEQVIANLLDNALRHGGDGVVEVSVAAIDGGAEISVRDHGAGIPAEHIPHIFDRFYQAQNSRHKTGLGLGLYISHEIVALHGGDIRVEAPADGGTRFVVTLPGCAPAGSQG